MKLEKIKFMNQKEMKLNSIIQKNENISKECNKDVNKVPKEKIFYKLENIKNKKCKKIKKNK